MKKLLFLFFISTNMCKCQVYAPGYDFKNFKNTPAYDLAKAVEADDTVKISKILQTKKENIDFTDPKFGLSLLTLAVIDNKNKSISSLLNLGADPNLKSPIDNSTPFLNACKYYYDLDSGITILSLLIRYGADVNAVHIQILENPGGGTYKFQQSAVEYLCSFGTLEAVKVLVDNGADLNAYPKNGEHSLAFSASINKELNILRYFLIDKNIPIPDYFAIRNAGQSDEEKTTITQVLNRRAFLMDEEQLKIRQEILDFVKAKGKE